MSSVLHLPKRPRLRPYLARCPACGEFMAWDQTYPEAWCVSRYCKAWGKRVTMPPKESA